MVEETPTIILTRARLSLRSPSATPRHPPSTTSRIRTATSSESVPHVPQPRSSQTPISSSSSPAPQIESNALKLDLGYKGNHFLRRISSTSPFVTSSTSSKIQVTPVFQISGAGTKRKSTHIDNNADTNVKIISSYRALLSISDKPLLGDQVSLPPSTRPRKRVRFSDDIDNFFYGIEARKVNSNFVKALPVF